MTKSIKGSIAAGHILTAKAGKEMFEQGGNAFDAALAAMLSSCVTEPCTTSAAGGGFLLAHTAHNQQSVLYDFFSQTPQTKLPLDQLDFFPKSLLLGATEQTFHIGMASAAIPGFLKGWFHVHERLGSLPVDVIMEPAIRQAKEGVVVSDYQASVFDMLGPIVTHPPEGKALYWDESGGMIQGGHRLFMPEFADTLAYLSREGGDVFYKGEIAQRIVKDCKERGGHLRMNDFSDFEVIERKPLACTYRNHTLLTNPPPCSGGLLIAFALKLLESIDFADYSHGIAAHVQILAEVMAQTNSARKEHLDAFIHQLGIAEQFLATDLIQAYQQKVLLKRGSTTHISVVDEMGNAVSVTTSFGEGCGYYIPGTQILLNNMLGEEDLNPNGFHSWQENVRLSSMMSPSIVLDAEKRVKTVTGSGGANRIRTAILQVLHHLLDLGMDVNQAVNAARVHFENGHLYMESGLADCSGFFSQDQMTEWNDLHHFFGGTHTVFFDGEKWTGAGDVRRAGAYLDLHF